MEVSRKKQLINSYKKKAAVGGVYRITCSGNNHSCIKSTTDMEGIKNRFNFAQLTKSCPDPTVQNDWLSYGNESLLIEVLEELVIKEGQTAAEFADDIEVLYQLWQERLDAEQSK